MKSNMTHEINLQSILLPFILTIKCICGFSQSQETLNTLTANNWVVFGNDSILNGQTKILELDFHSGFKKIESGVYKNWSYGEEGIMSHKIEKGVRTSYSIYEYLIMGDSLKLNVTSRSAELNGAAMQFNFKYSFNPSLKELILTKPDNKKLRFKADTNSDN